MGDDDDDNDWGHEVATTTHNPGSHVHTVRRRKTRTDAKPHLERNAHDHRRVTQAQ